MSSTSAHLSREAKSRHNLSHSIEAEHLRLIDEFHVTRDAGHNAWQIRLQALALNAKEKRQRAEIAKKFWGKKWDAAEKACGNLAGRYRDRVKHVKFVPGFETPVVVHGGPLDIPLPADNSFWWAFTTWQSSPEGISVDFPDDGIHFFGRVSYDGDDLKQFSVSAISTYELQSARIPASVSGRFNSEPKIELQRTIDGWTGFYDFPWAADDKWCKCRLALRQTVFQIGFAAQLAVLADRTEVRTLIDEENRSRGVSVPLPGIVEMPAVQFAPATNYSIWVDLEVRFDIELEGDSFIGFSPEQNSAGSVLLNMPQWKLVAA